MKQPREADKKDLIIAAAYKILAEQGYDKASTKEIAREAGVAQGLINYYFPSKEELFLEIFRTESDRFCNSLQAIKKLPLDEHFVRNAMKIPIQQIEDNPDLFRLRYEMFAIGFRSEAAREELARSLCMGREEIQGILERANPGDPVNEGMTPIIKSFFDGLAMQKTIDPAFDAQPAYEAFAAMLEAYLEKRRNK